AQKQIICPIYRGYRANHLYRQGLEPIILDGTGPLPAPQRMKRNSFLQEIRNPDSFNQFSGLSAASNLDRNRRYSAARTSFGLVVTDEIMKSEIRGTFSERNREPLN